MSKVARVVFALTFLGAMVVSPLFIRSASAGVVPGNGPCATAPSVGFMDLLNLVDNVDQAASSGATVTTSISAQSIQIGTEISAAEKVEIENTLASLISCINKPDPMRVVGLLSEHFQSMLVLDLLSGADAMSVLAQQIPDILTSPSVSNPLETPEILKAWHQSAGSSDIAAIISMAVPGQTGEVSFYVVFTPVNDTWKIDEFARYND